MDRVDVAEVAALDHDASLLDERVKAIVEGHGVDELARLSQLHQFLRLTAGHG